MNLDQPLHTFMLECRELLDEMEHALLALERPAEDKGELVNALFRSAHTIKGSAGLFGLDEIVAFTHHVESVLDEVRAGTVPLTAALIGLLLACRDQIASLVAAAEAGQMAADAELARAGAPLVAQLQRYLAPRAPALPGPQHGFRRPEPGAPSGVWHLSLRFGPDVLKNGMEPQSFLHYLGKLGRIVDLCTVHEQMPAAALMDVELCYLGFEIAFISDADQPAIEQVFEFVRDDCVLTILPPHSAGAAYLRLLADRPALALRLEKMFLACGTITAQELAAARAPRTGAPPAASPAQPAAPAAGPARSLESSVIRVDADKLDRLIDLVGELIIAGASVSLAAHRTGHPELAACTATLSGLVDAVRDSTLQLRMVKIGATFNRFQRVVHDVAHELGKDVRLLIAGEDTELDKTVIEKIADPLTHLIRNALDHGIEPAALRLARGKPAQGSVQLKAYHAAGHIVVEVSDDGAGLQRDKIMAKALERGLIEAGRTLSERELHGLIFDPGFSTAETVTNLSGRGVGMDVVKRNIKALRGSIEVDSTEGVGTTVSVRLPLTLAIIDGFLVGVGSAMFVIPLDMIEECIAFPPDAQPGYTSLRGAVLPFIGLRPVFGIRDLPARREHLVVVRDGGRLAGLVVDTLLGQFQAVIKPLAKMFKGVNCISGSTVLGNGELALILDVPALLKECAGRHAQQAA